MREIKFRAWDNENKRWWPNIEVYSDGTYNVGEVEDSYSGLIYSEQKPTLQQFTGFKDTNDKDIFEGDILEDNEYPDDGISRDVVIWSEELGRWTTHEWSIDGEEFEGCEVVGNIHENPEILK